MVLGRIIEHVNTKCCLSVYLDVLVRKVEAGVRKPGFLGIYAGLVFTLSYFKKFKTAGINDTIVLVN